MQPNNKTEYTLSFIQAMEMLVNGKTVQGDNFHQDCVLTLDIYGKMQLINKSNENPYNADYYMFLKPLMTQKYKVVD
jgi:hypothetical protein